MCLYILIWFPQQNLLGEGRLGGEAWNFSFFGAKK
jgi:hypothetical protein